MYLLYVDESGDPAGWADQKNYVLGAVAVHEGQVRSLSNKLMKIQKSYFPNVNIPLAFHAYEIRSGRGHYRNLPEAKREELLNEIYDVIGRCGFPKLITFAIAINISAVESSQQAFRDVFEQLCTRFNSFLNREFITQHPNKGLLIIDRAHEGHYRQLIEEFRRSGTRYGVLTDIIDIPYFAGRKDTRMLQLADFCAHAVFQYYEHKDSTYLDKIVHCFDKRRGRDVLDGLKHVTKESCSCIACSGRR